MPPRWIVPSGRPQSVDFEQRTRPLDQRPHVIPPCGIAHEHVLFGAMIGGHEQIADARSTSRHSCQSLRRRAREPTASPGELLKVPAQCRQGRNLRYSREPAESQIGSEP